MGVDAAIDIAWRVAMSLVGVAAVVGIVMVMNNAVPPVVWSGVTSTLSVIGVFIPLPSLAIAIGLVVATGAVSFTIGISRKSINTSTAGTIEV